MSDTFNDDELGQLGLTRAEGEALATRTFLPRADGKHRCPKDGCTRMVPRSMLACRPHWMAVPAPLRAEVNAAWWRGYRNDPGRYLAAREAAVEEMNR